MLILQNLIYNQTNFKIPIWILYFHGSKLIERERERERKRERERERTNESNNDEKLIQSAAMIITFPYLMADA